HHVAREGHRDGHVRLGRSAAIALLGSSKAVEQEPRSDLAVLHPPVDGGAHVRDHIGGLHDLAGLLAEAECPHLPSLAVVTLDRSGARPSARYFCRTTSGSKPPKIIRLPSKGMSVSN